MDLTKYKMSLIVGSVIGLGIFSVIQCQALSLPQVSSIHPNEGDSFTLSETEYLALEGGFLLPEKDAVAKVDHELSLIRENFPAIREIKHNRKWIPGQVLTTKINQDQIDKLNKSSFGPLKHVEKLDVRPFFFVTVLSFNKPYSPPVLSKELESELGISFTPNSVYYEYEVDNIGYRNANSTYIFKKGTGMCTDNCSDRYLWEFTIEETGNPKLVKEWSVPQNGERVVIF